MVVRNTIIQSFFIFQKLLLAIIVMKMQIWVWRFVPSMLFADKIRNTQIKKAFHPGISGETPFPIFLTEF